VSGRWGHAARSKLEGLGSLLLICATYFLRCCLEGSTRRCRSYFEGSFVTDPKPRTDYCILTTDISRAPSSFSFLPALLKTHLSVA
jgi:hypothetical protein